MPGDEREMGRLEAKVDMLMDMVKGLETKYVTKAEYEPRISALENNNHKIWDKMIAFGTIGSFVLGGIALIRTIH